ncbi:type II toxin-antitoxin system VapB family antitoxin [Acidovorax sp. LjRoot66]|uniref:type II toxin-antitoxin system VapB family antitoxin n=1 Tax=Acidovorax sp. LjRoot66 TaxID=3342334 RepID=UPI003ECCB162
MRITVTIDDALYEDALQFAPPGITQAELIREALKTFVRIESAKRLAALGGSTPDLQEPPRRKP